jgi:NADPH2:quinone reductase
MRWVGDWVLVHAAAGGVGLAAVQIAKAFGATVIATAGTQHKQDVARDFGADYAIDYRQPDWPEQVKKLTPKGRGVDIVYDPVGLIAQSMKCIAWNGRLLVIGFAAGSIETMATNRILLKNVSVVGLHWGICDSRTRNAGQGLGRHIQAGTGRQVQRYCVHG